MNPCNMEYYFFSIYSLSLWNSPNFNLSYKKLKFSMFFLLSSSWFKLALVDSRRSDYSGIEGNYFYSVAISCFTCLMFFPNYKFPSFYKVVLWLLCTSNVKNFQKDKKINFFLYKMINYFVKYLNLLRFYSVL